jgi:hypothetical protein
LVSTFAGGMAHIHGFHEKAQSRQDAVAAFLLIVFTVAS